MISEKSLHRKIQLVLEQVSSSGATSLAALHDVIDDRRLPNFNTRQYDAKKDEFRWRQSARAIRKTIRLCVELGLIDETAELSKSGRAALRKAHFNEVLATTIRTRLAQDGVAMDRLNVAIRRGLQADRPALPTAKELWLALAPNMPAGEFSRFLTLLSHCGVARSFQGKVYLEFQTD